MDFPESLDCFIAGHSRPLFLLLKKETLFRQPDLTFERLRMAAEAAHRRKCACNRDLEDTWLIQQDWEQLEPEERSLSTAVWVDPNERVLPRVLDPFTSHYRPDTYVAFSVKGDDQTPAPSTSFRLVHDLVCVPTSGDIYRIPRRTDNHFSALRDRCVFIDKASSLDYVHIPQAANVEVILRPRGFGKSTFLSTLADIKDIRPASLPGVPPVMDGVFRSPTQWHLRRAWSMVLFLDFASLDIASVDELETSLNALLRAALIAFMEKYAPELGLDAALVLENGPTSALRTITAAVRRTPSQYEMFLCIDNYTAPYDHLSEEVWGDATAVLDRVLYRAVRDLATSRDITWAFLVGSSETVNRASPSALTQTFAHLDGEVDVERLMLHSMSMDPPEFGDYEPEPEMIPFTGMLREVATDLTRFDLLQCIMGMTLREARALGQVVLGDGEGFAEQVRNNLRAWTFQSRFCTTLGFRIVEMYSYEDVLSLLRQRLGRPNDWSVILDHVYVDEDKAIVTQGLQ
ncbi:hypothetical protein C8Q76DRAFT_726896 [Earliella scabrosa]|nr:hypothetical protein C8Q76DRAFT_726896 [Earliella scabrosa]